MIARRHIEHKVQKVAQHAPLPEGFKYVLESASDGVARRYLLSVRREDMKGGDFLTIPRWGEMLKTREFYQYLHGVLDGITLSERLKIALQKN